MYKKLPILICLIFALNLAGCDAEVKSRANTPLNEVQPSTKSEEEPVSNTDNENKADEEEEEKSDEEETAEETVFVPVIDQAAVLASELRFNVPIVDQNSQLVLANAPDDFTPKNAIKYNLKIETNAPEFILDDIKTDYDALNYDTLNQAINSLAEKEYISNLQQDSAKKTLIAPATTFILANFLDFSAAGTSKQLIRQGLEWEVTENWPLPMWADQFGNPLSTRFPMLLTQAWGDSSYQYSSGYVTSLKETFLSSYKGLDYANTEESLLKIKENMPTIFTVDESILQTALTSISSGTRLTFSSSISMNIKWAADTSSIKVRNGVMDSGAQNRKAPLMKWAGMFRRFDTETFRAVVIPLNDNKTSMTVIMPVDEVAYQTVEADIFTVLDEIEQSSIPTSMDFVLPVFTMVNQNRIDVEIPSGLFGMLSDPDTLISDYSKVNVNELLWRAGLSAGSSFSLTSAGIELASIGITSLSSRSADFIIDAPGDEPSEDSSSANDSNQTVLADTPDFTPLQVATNDFFSDCDIIGEKSQVTQVLPFIFVIKNMITDSVIQLGGINNLEGSPEKIRDVCVSERIERSENIWPTYPRQEGVVNPHVNSSTYISTSNLPFEPTAINSGVKAYNPIAIRKYLVKTAPNLVKSSMTHTSIQAMIDYGKTRRPASEGLAGRIELSNSPTINDLSSSVRSKVWVEADYEIREDYLDILSQLSQTLEVRDILHNPDELIANVKLWSNDIIDDNILTGLINNRTRLLFGSSIYSQGNLSGNRYTGNFVNGNNLLTNIDLVKFTGRYSALETPLYKAVDVPFTENNVNLLIIFPTENQFSYVEESLEDVLERFSQNAETKQISFTLPELQISQIEVSNLAQYPGYYRSVSELRLLIPRPESTVSRLSISPGGIRLASYSLAAFVAPAVATTGSGDVEYEKPDSFLAAAYDADNVNSLGSLGGCVAQSMEKSSANSRPFIFVLRDRATRSIIHIGRVKAPRPTPDTRKLCVDNIAELTNEFWAATR